MPKPVSQMRRPTQDPRAGKFNNKMSVKSKTASDMVASRDVDNFDRGGESGRPHMEGVNPVSVIARYATLGRALKTNESFSKVAQQIAQIAEMAEQTVMQEAGDWFDEHTIKRNMKEMKNYAGQFAKIAEELDTLQQRATALYDDMGNVLTRYFEINDAQDGEEGEEESPATSPEGTEFDRAASDMGNEKQQGWTEGAEDSYAPGYFTHDEDDTEEDREETEKMKDAARKAVANRFPKPKNEDSTEDYLEKMKGDIERHGMKEVSPAELGNQAGKLDALGSRLGIEMKPGESRQSFADRVYAASKNKQEGGPGSGPRQGNPPGGDALPWATGEEKKWSNGKLAKEIRSAKDSIQSGQLSGTMAQKWLELLSKEAQRRGVKEGRGFATPGSQDYKNNFKTQGLEGEARGDIANFGPKKQKPFSGRNQPTREERMIVAKEFAQNPAALNRVVNTFRKNEIKEMLKSGRARNLKEARKMIAKEAISRFAVKAKKLLERGPVVKEAASPEQKIAQLKNIVDNHQATKVDGQIVDSFSASAILAVYRALNEENKAKFAAMPVRQMAIVAFKLVK